MCDVSASFTTCTGKKKSEERWKEIEMKYLNFRLIAFLLITAITAFVALHDGTASSAAQSQGNGSDNKFRRARKPVPGQYLVVLNPDTRPEDVEFVANQLLATHQGTTLAVYRHTIKGFAIRMP